MKKLIILLSLTAVVAYASGQTYYSCTIPASITNSRNYVCTGNITMSGTRSISNNSTVKIVAKQVTIDPGFSTTLGTNVTIEAMANPALRSDESYEESEYANTVTSVDTPETDRKVKSVKVYMVTGQRVYSSEVNTDIYSIGLNEGIYIIQKEYDNGETVREKVIVNI